MENFVILVGNKADKTHDVGEIKCIIKGGKKRFKRRKKLTIQLLKLTRCSQHLLNVYF